MDAARWRSTIYSILEGKLTGMNSALDKSHSLVTIDNKRFANAMNGIRANGLVLNYTIRRWHDVYQQLRFDVDRIEYREDHLERAINIMVTYGLRKLNGLAKIKQEMVEQLKGISDLS